MSFMKRLIISMLVMVYMFTLYIPVNAAGIQICYDGATHLYTGEVYKLYVNGKKIESAMEPIIFNDHALVPVREVFETCGATVDYDGDAKCVKVNYKSMRITMHINNNCAYINGQPVKIPDNVVPKLIYKPGELTKTMVPVRFISESVGMNVDFDGATGKISITEEEPVITPSPTPKPTSSPVVADTKLTINSIKTEMVTDTKISVKVACDSSLEGAVSHFKLSSPERVVVDIKNAKYKVDTQTITIDSDLIKSVRVGVDDERARLVIDVTNLKSYDVDISGKSLIITATVTASSATPKPTATPTPTKKPDYNQAGQSAANSQYNTGIVKASAADAKKIIMLDAGHGGTDPGALGTLNGKTIKEKDLTLSITYKVKAILESNGYKTAMTRTGDTLPTLAERPEMANKKDCALFVSIHINSATESEAKGTEVYYSEENNGDEYGLTSQRFATNVLNGMLKYMKSTDRGVRMANWAVTRRANMPAVLVEVGFISNTSELKLMCSDDYQNKTARGIAEGIINTIHYVEVP